MVQTGKARQRYTAEHVNQQTHVMAHCILGPAASPQTEEEDLNIFTLRDLRGIISFGSVLIVVLTDGC